ncbi:MAG: DUF5050 domain-containing protein [Bacillota bacterium]
MKKITISVLLVLSLVTSLFYYPVLGGTSEVHVSVRGELLTLETSPLIESGRTLVPMRDIFESLDAFIEWDGSTKTVTATKGETVIKLRIGDKTAYLNGQAIQLDVPAKIKNNRTLVPIRFISESLGAKVDWDDMTRTVTISVDNSGEVRGNTPGNITNGGFVGVKDDWVYVSMYKAGLSKVKKDGSEKVKISDSSVNYMNIVGDWIYYSSSYFLEEDDRMRLYKMKLDGSSPTRLSEDIAGFVNVVGDWIYYVNGSDDDTPYKVRLDGKGAQKISDISMKYMTVEDGWIYFQRISDDTLCKMRTSGSDVKELCDVTGSDMYINKVGDWIYFSSDSDDPGIYRVSKDGRGKKMVIRGMVDSINYEDGWIYYSSMVKKLYKIRDNLSERKTVAINIEGSLNIADDWLYYTEYVDEAGREFRIKNDGSVKQRLDTDEPLTDIVLSTADNPTYTPKPVEIPPQALGTTVLSPKEIAKNKDAVAFIKTYDENGSEIGSGSGFNIKSSGIVITNFHVISGASSIKCTLNNTQYDVDYILNYSTIKDIAILQLKDASNLPVVRLGDSSKIELAEDVVAIGNPLELQNTVSTGIVSGIRTMFGIEYIQTNASISPGSSGGPLFNSYGDVIGMTTMSALGSQNINFAIPVNSVKKLFPSSAVIPIESVNYYEASIEEFEPNDNMGTANEFFLNQYLVGSFDDNKDADYYTFTLNKPGKVSFYGFAYLISGYTDMSSGFSMTLLDEKGNEISVSSKSNENGTDVQKISSDLKEGTYYIKIKVGDIDFEDVDFNSYMLLTILDD